MQKYIFETDDANEALELLNLWKRTKAALATAKQYTIGDRQLSRADMGDIDKNIKRYKYEYHYYTGKLKRASPIIRIIPKSY